MLALLEKRYCGQESGNGPAWAFVPHVRNAAGFNATRTIDALAMSLWPSRGLELHGHEIKCSRADWLREMRDPSKAEAFCKFLDRWWLVVADRSIVKDDELPPTWGLMVATGRGLVVATQAPLLKIEEGQWMPRTFLAALMRASVRTAAVQPAEIAEAVVAAVEAERKLNADNVERWREERDGLRETIRAFEQASGVQINGHTYGYGHTPEATGAALRAVLNGESDAERFVGRFRSLADTAERLAGDLRRAAGEAAS